MPSEHVHFGVQVLFILFLVVVFVLVVVVGEHTRTRDVLLPSCGKIMSS